MQKKSARRRHRYFVCTQYRVIKIKSLSYIYWIYPPEIKVTPDAPNFAKQKLHKLGPISVAEKITLADICHAFADVDWFACDYFW
ncbi:hypothetical protein ARSQ2_01353 [Arsenophonus endosymbiont of Bemisia tabaci Q2]|nr:hypothetical protein ARSQ2_01353 [Arsenophonus endosymbiont of Bemisia tabaci Q2]